MVLSLGTLLVTGREIDAAIAEALGCKVAHPVAWPYPQPACGCPVHLEPSYPHGIPLHTYFTAPTGDTMLQIIEGLAKPEHGGWEWRGGTRGSHHVDSRREQCWSVFLRPDPDHYAAHLGDNASADTLPAAVVRAACKALGIQVED